VFAAAASGAEVSLAACTDRAFLSAIRGSMLSDVRQHALDLNAAYSL
jgi:hypothetical protein